MNRKTVQTSAAPAAVGPYSQAVRANGFLFVSGQIPLDPATGALAGPGIDTQTRQVLKNIRAILESQGLTEAHVVKTTIFLRDMNDFQTVNGIYAGSFPVDPPARETVEVSRLPKDVRIEISAIAVIA